MYWQLWFGVVVQFVEYGLLQYEYQVDYDVKEEQVIVCGGKFYQC